MVDLISSQKIREFLDDSLKNRIKIEVLEKTTSTNELVRGCAAENSEGLVVIAGEQTAGRGRMGRSFFSPGNSGVYMSILLKPAIKPSDAVQITTAAAVGVCKALKLLGIKKTGIKWVNDIFINNRKVCGILTESSFNAQSGLLDFAVLGVGINVYESENGFPDDIKNIAGAVFAERQTDLRNRLVAAFLKEFFDYYDNISSKKHLNEYRANSFVLGKEITVIQGDKTEKAKAVDIDDDCNLVAEFSDGTIKKLFSGEISVKLT